jgi:hypothetical protein
VIGASHFIQSAQDALVSWHRRGFARFWAWKSRPIGRPPLDSTVVALIDRMAAENPLWSREADRGRAGQAGPPRRQGHGGEVHAETGTLTGAAPVDDWRAFVRAHLAGTIAIDTEIARLIRDRMGSTAPRSIPV